jgi:hypothetical protein
MEVLYARCCGLDVHRSKLVACLSIIEAGQRHKDIYLWYDDQRIAPVAPVADRSRV